MSRAKSPVVLRQISAAFHRLIRMSSQGNSRPLEPMEAAKWAVAGRAVELHVRSGQRIGVGTGSTAKYLVDHMAERFRSGALTDIVCVPSSFQARHLILAGGLPLSDLERCPELDICIDGADEVDADLTCIKGGGGCLTQEKIVQSCSKRFIVIADYRKASSVLGQSYPRLPIEVIPFAYAPVRARLARELGGTVELRMASKKAGPVITDSGNYLLDWEFPKTATHDWAALHTRIKLIPGPNRRQWSDSLIWSPFEGVVETGLFVGVAEQALFGQLDGEILTRERPTNGTNGHH